MGLKLTGSAWEREYNSASLVWRCPCGVMFDQPAFETSLPLERIQARPQPLALPGSIALVSEETTWQTFTMGEGFTLLISLVPDTPHILLKVEEQMPTFSFQDRGALGDMDGRLPGPMLFHRTAEAKMMASTVSTV